MAPDANSGTGKCFFTYCLLFYFYVEKTRYPVGLHSLYTTHLTQLFCDNQGIVSERVKNLCPF